MHGKTTRLSALATGLRLKITAQANPSISAEKSQKRIVTIYLRGFHLKTSPSSVPPIS